MRLRTCPRLLFCAGFAFLAGYTEVVSVARFNAFSCTMIGNIVFGCRCIAFRLHERAPFENTLLVPTEPPPSGCNGWNYLVIVTLYFLGTSMYHLAEKKLPGRGASIVASAFLLIFVGWDLLSNLLRDPTWQQPWVVYGLAPIFGVQHAVALGDFLSMNATTVNGHLQNLAYCIVKIFYHRLSHDEMIECLFSLVTVGIMILGLVIGNMAMKALSRHDASWCLLPVGPLMTMLLLVLEIRQHHYNKDDYSEVDTSEGETARDFEEEPLSESERRW